MVLSNKNILDNSLQRKLLSALLISLLCSCIGLHSDKSIVDVTVNATVLSSDYTPLKNEDIKICINSHNSLLTNVDEFPRHFVHCNSYLTDSNGVVNINYYGEFPLSSYSPPPFDYRFLDLVVSRSFYIQKGKDRYIPIDAGIFDGGESYKTTLEGINYIEIPALGDPTGDYDMALDGVNLEKQKMNTENPKDRGIVLNAKVVFLLDESFAEQDDYPISYICDEDAESVRVCVSDSGYRYSDFGVDLWDVESFCGSLVDYFPMGDTDFSKYIKILSEAYQQ